jgi:cation transport ATPase
MRAQGIGEVLYLSSQSAPETAKTAAKLGFDVHHGGLSTEAIRNFIAERQFLGRSVAYFGDCTRQALAAEHANLAVSVLNSQDLNSPGAPLALLLPDLARCSVLYSLAQARNSSVSSAFISSVVPNVAAMTGAIYLDFSVLSSVILTNLGTLVSYYRWRRTLQSAQ